MSRAQGNTLRERERKQKGKGSLLTCRQMKKGAESVWCVQYNGRVLLKLIKELAGRKEAVV